MSNKRILIGLVIILLEIFFLYKDVISNFVYTIIELNRYEFLIVSLIYFILLYEKIKFFKLPEPKPKYFGGILLFLLSFLFLLTGNIGGLEVFKVFSLIFVIGALTLLLFGTAYFKLLIIPTLYFILSYAILEFSLYSNFIATIQFNLQIFTASIAYILMKIIGVIVIQWWEYLFLPHVTLYVGPACSGLNHTFAICILSLLLIFVGQKTSKQKIILFTLAFVIGIIMNGIRVALIGIWSFFSNDISFHGPHDIFLVVFIFIAGSMLMVILSLEFDSETPTNIFKDKMKFSHLFQKLTQHKTGWILSLLLPIIGLFSISLIHIKPIQLSHNLSLFPTTIDGWEGHDILVDINKFKIANSDDSLERIYTNPPNDTLIVYIAYFTQRTQGKELVNYRTIFLNSSAREINIPLDDKRTIFVNYSLYPLEEPIYSIFFCYYLNDRLEINPIAVKVYTILEAILKQKTNGALILILSKYDKNEQMENPSANQLDFVRKLLPVVQSFLGNTSK